MIALTAIQSDFMGANRDSITTAMIVNNALLGMITILLGACGWGIVSYHNHLVEKLTQVDAQGRAIAVLNQQSQMLESAVTDLRTGQREMLQELRGIRSNTRP